MIKVLHIIQWLFTKNNPQFFTTTNNFIAIRIKDNEKFKVGEAVLTVSKEIGKPGIHGRIKSFNEDKTHVLVVDTELSVNVEMNELHTVFLWIEHIKSSMKKMPNHGSVEY